jgi:hypothetical protein
MNAVDHYRLGEELLRLAKETKDDSSVTGLALLATAHFAAVSAWASLTASEKTAVWGGL